MHIYAYMATFSAFQGFLPFLDFYHPYNFVQNRIFGLYGKTRYLKMVQLA